MFNVDAVCYMDRRVGAPKRARKLKSEMLGEMRLRTHHSITQIAKIMTLEVNIDSNSGARFCGGPQGRSAPISQPRGTMCVRPEITNTTGDQPKKQKKKENTQEQEGQPNDHLSNKQDCNKNNALECNGTDGRKKGCIAAISS